MGILPGVGSSGMLIDSRDPYFSYVQALLHFDGTDGSTTLTDSSSLAATFTRSGTGQIDTAQSKFGGASYLNDGSGDQCSSPSDAAYAIGTGDFTVEFWVRFNTISSGDYFFSTIVSGGLAVFRTTTPLQLHIARQSVGTDLSVSWDPSTGIWYHVAATRSGSTARLFVDGVELGSGTVTSNYGQNGLRISGGGAAADSVDGWMDDVRFTVGVARYTSSFAPPSEAYPNS